MLLRIWLISAIALHGLSVPLSASCGPRADSAGSCCSVSTGSCCVPSDGGEQVPPEDCEPSFACFLCVVLCGQITSDVFVPPSRVDLDKVLTGAGSELGEIQRIRPVVPAAGLAPRFDFSRADSAHEVRARLCIWLN